MLTVDTFSGCRGPQNLPVWDHRTVPPVPRVCGKKGPQNRPPVPKGSE